MKPYKIILDDYRSRLDVFRITRNPVFLVDDWSIATTHEQFVDVVSKMHEQGFFPSLVAFDHDLVDEHYKYLVNPIPYEKFTVPTGWHSAKWFVAFCERVGLEPSFVFVHTMNPAGRANIEEVLREGGLHH